MQAEPQRGSPVVVGVTLMVCGYHASQSVGDAKVGETMVYVVGSIAAFWAGAALALWGGRAPRPDLSQSLEQGVTMNMPTAPVATKKRDVNDFKAGAPPAIGLKHPGWIIWFLWVAASIVGFVLSAAAFLGSAMIYMIENPPPIIVGTVYSLARLLLPTLPAFLHWLILRRLFARAGWWIPASVVGWLLGYIALNVGIAGADTGQGFLFISAQYVFSVACAVAGAAAGTMQWLVLRRWVSRAGWWVLASSISWVGAAWVYASLTRGSDVHIVLGAATSGVLSGAVTGAVLVWLLRHPLPASAHSNFVKEGGK